MAASSSTASRIFAILRCFFMLCLSFDNVITVLFAAASAHAEQHGFAAVERKTLAFVQLRGEPCGSLLGQVKGLSALGAGHVQHALARRGIGVLIEYLACAGSGTAAHFPLGFECRKIAVNCALNTNDDKELYHQAALASKAVIDACLANGVQLGKYSDLWGSNNWQAKELIYAIRMGAMNAFEYDNYPRGLENGNGGNCPTQTLVDAYEMKNGKLWNEEGSGYDAQNPYANRDPRFGMTIAVNGEKKWPSYNGDALETYYGGKNGEPIVGATPTGYYLKKYCDGNVNISSVNSTSTPHAWVVFRLGEFYLDYAEAVFKYLGSADAVSADLPMSAREAVNVIRNREDVKMPELAEGLSNDEFWKKYENERMVELAFEDHRFYDVRRWKEGNKLATITEMKITKNEDGSFNYTRKVVNRGWNDKMYFFPISKSELLKHTNPEFKQNPGWE